MGFMIYDDELQENLWEFELLRDDDGIHRFFPLLVLHVLVEKPRQMIKPI